MSSIHAAILILALFSATHTGGLAVNRQEPSAKKGPTRSSAQKPRVDSGRVVYRKACGVCHGEAGKGTPRARPLVGDRLYGTSVNEIIAIVRDGLKGTTMPGFRGGISDAEIRAVARYVASLK